MTTAAQQAPRIMAEPSIANLIVGLGRTGLACAEHFARRGEPFAVIDSRPQPPALAAFRAAFPAAPLFLGGFDPMVFWRARRLILSPGVSAEESVVKAARQRGVEIVGDIELFARVARAPVAAITGSNGKSTVTALLGEMARTAGRDVRVGGNIGTPALSLLQEREPDLYVLELSSFQLETTASLDAATAAVLNISPDHLDRYPDVAAYSAAKARIYRGGGVMVINADDPAVRALATPWRRTLTFTLGAPAAGAFGLRQCHGRPWLAQGERLLMAAAELRIKGRHNTANALAALALGTALQLPLEAMLEALRCFCGLPHRSQWVAERDGVQWFDDSKATNVGAALAALAGLPGPIVLIAGGLGKGQDFTPLKEAVREKARAVILLGRDARRVEAALAGVVPVVRVQDMDGAVAAAARQAQPGDTVLLSPACASFDMFDGFEARGRAFAAAVIRRLQC